MAVKEKIEYLSVYYNSRGKVEVRDGMPDMSKGIKHEQLTALAYKLLEISRIAKDPKVSHSKTICYSWVE